MDKSDFISLWDAIEAISSRVPLLYRWHVAPESLSGWDKLEEKRKAQADKEHKLIENHITLASIPPFREYLYQHSAAADQLISAIANPASSVEAPVWLDVDQGMGWPRRTPEAEADGTKYLKSWSRVYRTWVEESRTGRWWVDREEVCVKSPRIMYLKLSDASRATTIGFARTALIKFLERVDIPYSDVAVDQLSPSDPGQNSLAPVSEAAEALGAVQTKGSAGTLHQTGRPGRRSPIHDAILAAIVQVGSQGRDTLVVYNKLLELSQKCADQFRPLVVGKEKGVWYAQGECEYEYTRKALAAFLRRYWMRHDGA